MAYEPVIFSIPEHNLRLLDSKISKLNRKAIKMGCGEIRVINHGSNKTKKQTIINRVVEL